MPVQTREPKKPQEKQDKRGGGQSDSDLGKKHPVKESLKSAPYKKQQEILRPQPETSKQVEEKEGKLRIKGESVHTPDLSQVSSHVIPLTGGTEKDNQGFTRPRDPTIVTVVFDKLEMLDKRIFPQTPGNVILSPPEDVTLIKGDTLRIIDWHHNNLGNSIKLGFKATYKEGKAEIQSQGTPSMSGGGYGKFIPSPTHQGMIWWAGSLTGVGGFDWSFKVEEVGKEGFAAVRLQEIGFGGGKDTINSFKIMEERAEKLEGYTLHQQAQFYGEFYGSVSYTKSGESKVLTVPGSQEYHLEKWEGHRDHYGKQAGFWVPINLTVSNKSGRDGRITVDVPKLKLIKLYANAKQVDDGKIMIKAGQTINMQVSFLGGECAKATLCFEQIK